MKHPAISWLLCLSALIGFPGGSRAMAPIEPVRQVDLSRYMGRWYVVASIPTAMERNGSNAVETYRLQPDGTVCTWFRFRKGGFDQPVRLIHSTATVVPDSGNARWSVHLYWLLRLQYLVGWLKPDYSQVLVVRDARDHLWYMARTPKVSSADYQSMLERARAMGYDTRKIVQVAQRWPESGPGSQTFEESCQ
jgi:apolipoprotein D and lipocalin family protein